MLNTMSAAGDKVDYFYISLVGNRCCVVICTLDKGAVNFGNKHLEFVILCIQYIPYGHALMPVEFVSVYSDHEKSFPGFLEYITHSGVTSS